MRDRSRPASATTTTLNSRPLAAWIVSSRTASAPSSSETASRSRRADRVLLADEADEPLDVGAAQLLVGAGEARELAEIGVAALPVAARKHGEVVVVLDEDALAEKLEREPRRALDEPLVPLQERAHEAAVVLGEIVGKRALDPLKIGRFSALARMRTSASFETPTNGDASTVSSASSS